MLCSNVALAWTRLLGLHLAIVVAAGAHLEGFTMAVKGAFGLVCFHKLVVGVSVFSLLSANHAVAFANMPRSIWI